MVTKIYVVSQEWNTPYDGRDYSIMGVYDSLELAQKKLSELYQEDLEWAKDKGCEIGSEDKMYDLVENNVSDWSTYIAFQDYDYWSNNEIIEKELNK